MQLNSIDRLCTDDEFYEKRRFTEYPTRIHFSNYTWEMFWFQQVQIPIRQSFSNSKFCSRKLACLSFSQLTGRKSFTWHSYFTQLEKSAVKFLLT